MIGGFTTLDTRVRRNWLIKPRWWEISVYIPRDTPLYHEAKNRACTMFPLTYEDMREPITEWLAANVHKKYHVFHSFVRFQNQTDALMFFMALK